MQGDDIGAFEQIVQAVGGPCIAQRQLGFDVVEDHAHPQAFGQHAHLGADVAVADDAQHLVARLEAAGGGLGPATAVAKRVLLRDAAQQHDGFGDHQLGHAARVGVGGVEDRHAQPARGAQIHLVGADAEAADGNQPFSLLKYAVGKVRARADAHDMGIRNARFEFGFRQRLFMEFDLAVAGALEAFHGAAADAFQQEHLDVLFRERGLHWAIAQGRTPSLCQTL